MKIKFFLESKRIMFICVTSLMTGIVYAFSTDVINNGASAAETFEIIIGYNDFFDYGFSNLQGIIILFILSLPMINYYEKDLPKVNTYIFSRIRAKSVYFMQKFLCLSLFCFMSSVLYFAAKIVFCGCFFRGINLFLCFVNFFLSLLIFSAVVCFVSIFIGSARAYLIAVISCCVMIFAVTVSYYNYSDIFAWLFVILNPGARYMLSWSDGYAEMLSDEQMELMSPYAGIIYFFLFIMLYLIIMNTTVNRINLSLRYFNGEQL